MKTSKISYFKAHLSEELRAVRNGERIVILDRDRPVAEVIPFQIRDNLVIRPPKAPLSFKKRSYRAEKDPLEYLMRDRQTR